MSESLREANELPAIVTVGSAHMDLIASVDRIPVAGESRTGTAFISTPGGKAGNQAAQAAKCGARSFIVSRIGIDHFGTTLRTELGARGIDTTYLARDGEHQTGVSSVLVSGNGEYASVIVPGAATYLDVADIERARPAFEAAALLLLQLEVSVEVSLAAARAARVAGAKVVLNAAPLSGIGAGNFKSLLDAADILVANAAELAAMARLDLRILDPERAARSVLAEQPSLDIVIVTLGANGSIAVSGQERIWTRPHDVAVVDTIGAGDAFLGAFAAHIAGGRELGEALRYGTVAGALTVTKPGALAGQPTDYEIRSRLS